MANPDGAKILHVDNDREMLTVFEKWLTMSTPHSVVLQAESVSQAQQLIHDSDVKTHGVNVVILDGTGERVAPMIRQLDSTIAIIGFAAEDIVRWPDFFVPKGSPPARLGETIDEAFALWQKRSSNPE